MPHESPAIPRLLACENVVCATTSAGPLHGLRAAVGIHGCCGHTWNDFVDKTNTAVGEGSLLGPFILQWLGVTRARDPPPHPTLFLLRSSAFVPF